MANLDEATKELVLSIIDDQKITVINSTHDPERYKNFDTILRLDMLGEKEK